MPLLKSRFMPLFSDPYTPNNIDCGDPEYCHQFIPGDHLRAQFYQTPCGQNELCDPLFNDATLGADLITNGTFTGSLASWSTTGNWAYGTNDAVCTAGAVSLLSQGSLAMTDNLYYRVTFDLTRTAGSVRVVLGDGAGGITSAYLDTTGSYSFDLFFSDPGDETIIFETDDEFAGRIDNVTLKEVTYACWTPTYTWSLSEDMACKTDDSLTGDLEESVSMKKERLNCLFNSE